MLVVFTIDKGDCIFGLASAPSGAPGCLMDLLRRDMQVQYADAKANAIMPECWGVGEQNSSKGIYVTGSMSPFKPACLRDQSRIANHDMPEQEHHRYAPCTNLKSSQLYNRTHPWRPKPPNPRRVLYCSGMVPATALALTRSLTSSNSLTASACLSQPMFQVSRTRSSSLTSLA